MRIPDIGRTIAEQINTGVIVVDLECNIVEFNRFMQVHANKSLEQVIGCSIFDVFPELPTRWFNRKLSSVSSLNSPGFCSWEQRHHLFELPHHRPITTDSHFMAQNCTFIPIEDNNSVEYVCILIEDATDVAHYQGKLNKALEELAKANRIDGLTQIFNRKHWEECLEKEFSRARRYDHDLALIMFDLDHFKRLNDNFGHQCGDKVLIETAQRVKALLRSCDLFGRYGGEEFAVILPETEVSGALDVAERIRAELEKQVFVFQDKELTVTTSVGVASIQPSDTRYENLIANTDAALYKAKALGRNQTYQYKVNHLSNAV
ncbi:MULTISPECIES: sensor domain-containing diguanylate cyclase [Thalassotalea]|uniref:sensor domain-containing diguanylate cyclase n=1 Tax=Thalassotalea TaxID=1518149 RepID=UPI000944A265|nr:MULTISPECIES: diguanylate cyclase [Thalassotalea]OKY25923.1 GGDEF domain-containing protein [Thalassotalea sp. PP2-459]